MKRLSLRTWTLVGIFAAFALASAPTAAWAVTDCRTVDSVKDSADLSQNETDGGHVAKHVAGKTAPAGYPRNQNTTLFQSEDSFDTVWANYLSAVLPDRKIADCTGTSGSIDKAASISELGLTELKIDKCDDASCSTTTETTARNVSFTFTYKTDKWILNSSFPME